MAVSFDKVLLGARGVQALLAVVVLGLMAYGMFTLVLNCYHEHAY